MWQEVCCTCMLCIHVVGWHARLLLCKCADISVTGFLKFQYFWKCWSIETPILWPPNVKNWLIWKDLEARLRVGEGDDRGWDGWMASLPRWTWIWMNSGIWWWTGRPGVLQSMGPQRVGHWAAELNRTELIGFLTFQIKYYWKSFDGRQLKIELEGFSLGHTWILRHPYWTLGLWRASGHIRDPLMILNTRWMIRHCVRIIPLSSLEKWWWGHKMEAWMDKRKRHGNRWRKDGKWHFDWSRKNGLRIWRNLDCKEEEQTHFHVSPLSNLVAGGIIFHDVEF